MARLAGAGEPARLAGAGEPATWELALFQAASDEGSISICEPAWDIDAWLPPLPLRLAYDLWFLEIDLNANLQRLWKLDLIAVIIVIMFSLSAWLTSWLIKTLLLFASPAKVITRASRACCGVPGPQTPPVRTAMLSITSSKNKGWICSRRSQERKRHRAITDQRA